MLFLKPDVTKKNRELFFRRICMESSEHNWANIGLLKLISLMFCSPFSQVTQ